MKRCSINWKEASSFGMRFFGGQAGKRDESTMRATQDKESVTRAVFAPKGMCCCDKISVPLFNCWLVDPSRKGQRMGCCNFCL